MSANDQATPAAAVPRKPRRRWLRFSLRTLILFCALFGSLPILPCPAAEEGGKPLPPAVDQALPHYKSDEQLRGVITAAGSPWMDNLMVLWGDEFIKIHPQAQVETPGKGGTTAFGALLDGRVDIGLTTRGFNEKEFAAFEAKYGHRPILLATAVDMLAVIVHKDNPVKSLSLPQVDAIFSSTRKLGAAERITTWGQVGLTGEWANRKITMHGRNVASSTFAFFKERALARGEFHPSLTEHGLTSVRQAVAADKGAIGYTGMGYFSDIVRAVPLAPSDDAQPVPAEFTYRNEYPLTRLQQLAVNYKSGEALPPLLREFLKFVFSQQGQAVVVKDGFWPVNAQLAHEQLEKVGLGDWIEKHE